MKPQRNFTTLEQSGVLLGIGVPADSADCYINTNSNTINVIPEDSPKYSEYCRSLSYLIPCWSTGRLIEIFEVCTETGYIKEDLESTVIGDVIYQIAAATQDDTLWPIDFSKWDKYINESKK